MTVHSHKLAPNPYRGSSDSRQIRWIVRTENSSDIEVLDYMQAQTVAGPDFVPEVYDGLLRSGFDIEQIVEPITGKQPYEYWSVTARYERLQPGRDDNPDAPHWVASSKTYNFTTSSILQKRAKTIAAFTLAIFPDGDPPNRPTIGGLVTDDPSPFEQAFFGGGNAFHNHDGISPESFTGQPQGTQILVPIITFTQTMTVPGVTAAYENIVYSRFLKMNSSTFQGRAAGEVLFTGFNASKTAPNVLELTFTFAIIPNDQPNTVLIGSPPNQFKIPILVKGWQLYHNYYREDATDDRQQAILDTLYIAEPYPEAELNSLYIDPDA